MEDGVALSRVRPVQVADLLRRAPIRIDRANVEDFIRGKRILVTGAGGSIGSELCRQLAAFAPAMIVMLDRAENGLFFVEMTLRDRHPALLLVSVIADITDESLIEAVFQEYKPQVAFHAAAHKHVPLMESNQAEAVKNNVLGTVTVANAACRAGVEDFVMISTDKAVRPSSVMGATKRVAEMFVQALSSRIETRFMTVRFGNVLGSEGSVLQVFQRQIEAGGPVTVTHPDMMRYFMTIPEACQLVLQAATQGEGGEIFLLDMGEPVRIVDLARDLITLMGLEPDKDIEVKFTGVRPGEKMFEELLNAETRVVPTKHKKIVVVETTPVDYDQLEAGIQELVGDAKAGRKEALVPRLKTLVPEYRGNGEFAAAPFGTRGRILLAAPDAYTRSTLRRILENGYELAEAESRRQLMDRLHAYAPHLVILDAALANVSVRRLCARIKNQNGNPPPSIILLTESAEAASLDQVRALGADDRLYRPIPVSVVEKRVRGLLGKAEAR
jgi:FlaA1/EpsC-like NDP-sugar epimerase